jgi:cell division protein FtsZ
VFAATGAVSPVNPTPTPSARAVQEEMMLAGEAESRGYFERTDRNLFEGQDLEVPTYLRKGIKIVL